MDNYAPLFDITAEALDKIAEIMENLGKLSGISELEKAPRLRRSSRVKSIHSSLAIENNTLSLEQVTDIINGKRVLGPQEDIIAVKNAFAAYNELDSIDPFSVDDLLRLHGIMMNGLIAGAGAIRSGDVGVFGTDGKLIHAAPPAAMARELIGQLFDWAKNTDLHMLIKSSVFHYEFEFIHPFNDGNGRMGRLWQTALLSGWKPIFKYIPIESVIRDNQPDYYKAFMLSTSTGRSTPFVLFMLDVINKAVKNIAADSRKHYGSLSTQINKLLSVMKDYPQSAGQLMARLRLKSRSNFRKNYLEPAIAAGLVAMTLPDKPTSGNQMYFKV